MPFKFSLAAVLRIRRILEEREESTLQKIISEIAQCRSTLERINAEIADSNASRVTDLFKSVLARHFQDSYGELKTLGQSRAEFELQIAKLEELRDRQRLVYGAARRNREMLTDMREDKHSEYEADVSKREQKVMDDNYIARRGRN